MRKLPQTQQKSNNSFINHDQISNIYRDVGHGAPESVEKYQKKQQIYKNHETSCTNRNAEAEIKWECTNMYENFGSNQRKI
jgi:hypothetical protein